MKNFYASQAIQAGLAGSRGLKQLQHLAVELEAFESFVLDIGAIAVEDAEGTSEIPEGPAPAGVFPEIEAIAHPSEGNLVGRILERPPLSDVDANPFGGEVFPGLDAFVMKPLAIPGLLIIDLEGPSRGRPVLLTLDPTGAVVADLHGAIASGTLGNAEIDKGVDGLLAPLQAIRNDEAIGIFQTDGFNEAADHASVGIFGQVGGFIDQIETDCGIGNPLVAFGEVTPVKGTGILGGFIGPEIEGFGRWIDAVARGAVEIEVDMDLVLLAKGDGLVDVFQHGLVEVEPIVGIGPAVIGEGKADKVEPPLGDYGEVFLAERGMASGGEFLEEVKASPTGELGGGDCRSGLGGKGAGKTEGGSGGESGMEKVAARGF